MNGAQKRRAFLARRLAEITLWLLAGHATVAAVIWGFLLIPESNVPMLLLSTITALLIVGAAGLVETVALLAWTTPYTNGTSGGRARIADAWRRLPAFLAGVTVFLAIWWAANRADSWWSAHRGEIDAWLLLQFAWTNTMPLHIAYGWLIWGTRYVLAVSLALELLQQGALTSSPGVWLREALEPRRLLWIAFWVLVLIVLPWRLVMWRPPGLPATWIEAAFVAAKLSAIAVVIHAGWALVLRASAERPVAHSTSVQDFPA